MKTGTKVLIGVGAAGVAGFIIWRLYEAGKSVGEGDLIIPDDTGWGGYDTTTNDGNGATWGPKTPPIDNMPTERYSRPAPLAAMPSTMTTPSGPNYTPAGKAAEIARILGTPRNPLGTETNKPFSDAKYVDPCAGIVCPPNFVCGGGKCYPVE